MFMDTAHPDFDPDMEVLCSLPRDPDEVPLALLVKDMGYSRHSDLKLKELGKRFGVVTHRSATRVGLVASILGCHWIEAQKACNDYWNKVYPDG